MTLSWRVNPQVTPANADMFSHGATFAVQRQDRQTASWEKGVLVASRVQLRARGMRAQSDQHCGGEV